MGHVDTNYLPRWWTGGVCSAIAVTTTQPLDLIKVQLQTQARADRKPVTEIIGNIYRQSGILGFYNGISASWFRQLTYTTTRFGLYEWGKQFVNSEGVGAKVGLAIFAGLCGGIVGVPGDVITVRLQNDSKLPPEKRRNPFSTETDLAATSMSLMACSALSRRRVCAVSFAAPCPLFQDPCS
ncbi:mitochondrial dicarboxylate carrier isoform X2 [Drosophila serrata]|uniref:mitochondrial dicarboxylate carrier isoform X2 n=1 Tax=Drosophila serrata TaxID=7274 RepID=UPI000A1D21D5|nr:mitochondrial dicarboxylate carrier isoform X2 [Drosophila serrata]